MSAEPWVPEARTVPEELTDEYDHEVYPPAATKFATIADQLDDVMRNRIREAFPFVNGGAGNV